MKKIMIDPGHGGHDPGAIGPTGVQEKFITVAVAKLMVDILKPVAEVRLTRDTDIALGSTEENDLQARVNAAHNFGADIFISIHCNSVISRAAHGCEVWTSPGQTAADAMAESIVKSLESGLTELSVRKDMSDGDSDKEARFAVLTRTRMPACLVELAFISNPTEEALLESGTFQKRAARAIAEGIAEYSGLQMPAIPTADNTIRIIVSDKILKGKLIDNRSYAPVRELAEALGREVKYDNISSTVTIL